MVAEFTVTLVTLAPIPLASGKLAKVLMADSSATPFCSSFTFSVTGVLASKNFSQFAVICAAASAVDPVPGLLGAAELGADAALDAALEGAPAADEVADLKEEMEQMRRQLAELSQRK